MKVKVGDTIYDAHDEPVMVILSDQDKLNILNMHPEATKYCAFPEGMDRDPVEKWMKEDKKG